jgi:hypothetical protein
MHDARHIVGTPDRTAATTAVRRRCVSAALLPFLLAWLVFLAAPVATTNAFVTRLDPLAAVVICGDHGGPRHLPTIHADCCQFCSIGTAAPPPTEPDAAGAPIVETVAVQDWPAHDDEALPRRRCVAARARAPPLPA